ncbi:PREDICTED: uncharacterized protein LOC105107425 isoform X2 [Populus euphratica]|uniref:Uncharacterized protein LOC105107425 isoform X2 n=1 Tax=Populus euphratica TaxID=75702 RepID=A0AAJ6SWH0_POPEU|nr:PREDICTED: uncharacterized protein LOC105107425 isoform X2 [Populus euphratica]
MNGESAAKIRFVRCPKCWQLLAEPQDIPVYECGGCGTHLRVKIRKSNPEVATSGLHETDAAQKNRSDHISEAKESSSSNHEENFLSPGECSSDQLNGRAASGDCDLDYLSGANLPEELQRSGSDRNGSEDFDSKQPGGVNSSHNQKNEIDKNDPGDSDNEHVVGVGSSNEHQQNGSGQNETEDCVDLNVIGTSLSSDDQERGNDSNESPECHHEQPEIFNEVQIQQIESGDCNDEHVGGMGGISTEAQNDWSDRNDSSDCNVEQAGFSYKVCSPTKLDEELSPLAAAKPKAEVNESGIQQNDSGAFSDEQRRSVNLSTEAEDDRSDQNDSLDFSIEQAGSDESSPLPVTKAELDAHSDSDGTSNDVGSPTKRAHLKNKEPSPLAGAKKEVEVSDESSPLTVTKAELDAHSDSDGTSNDDCSLTKLALLEKKELSSVEGEKSEAGASNESSQLAGAKALLDASKESGSDFIKSSIEKTVDKEGASVVTAQRPAGESISSDVFVTSPNEQLEKLHETGRHDFNRVQCADTFKTMDLIDPSSELSDSLIDLSKSPATRSSRAYYDDIVSSYEGTDDQLPDRPKHPFRNTHKQANHAASNERPRSEKFVANSSLGMQHHLKNHASIISDNNHRALKSSKLNLDELAEHTRVAHPARNWRRLEKDKYPSQAPFYQREFLAGYDNGSPSNQNNNESRSNLYFHSREKAAYTEQEKMKLLEMIYELQDQVNVLNGKEKGRVASGVTWKDHNPSYNDHLEQVIFDDLDYLSYPGRFRGGSNWHQQSKYSQMPFSAEVASNRNQVDHLCCCPQDWCLAQPPPPNLHHNRVFCKAQDRVEFYHSYGSCPTTPQRHADSEFSIYRRETLSDEHRRRDQEVKKYVKKKHHLAKRHLLPLAGGAPFITCFFCFKQLQLPADFLLSKRKYHRLRCGVCLEVLRFSLISRTHLVPYTPTADAPPPSEVDEHSGGLHMRISASSSHASNCPNVDPVSCSEDYGLPFCKSGSTDGDPVQTSLRSAESSLNERRKNPKEKHELSGPSSRMSKTKKVSSEIEELPRKGGGGSPLHRLMGYSSPSRLIYVDEPSCSSWYYTAED